MYYEQLKKIQDICKIYYQQIYVEKKKLTKNNYSAVFLEVLFPYKILDEESRIKKSVIFILECGLSFSALALHNSTRPIGLKPK